MRRRITRAVLAGALGLTGVTVSGVMTTAAARIPPVCVTHAVGPTQIEVGYCPDGPG